MSLQKRQPTKEELDSMNILDKLISEMTEKNIMKVTTKCMPFGFQTLVSIDKNIMNVLTKEETTLLTDGVNVLAAALDKIYENPEVMTFLFGVIGEPQND